MRSQQDFPRVPRRAPQSRRRLWIVLGVVIAVVVLASLHTLATLYTDYLWFGSVHLSEVWNRLLEVKLGLLVGFAAVFFVMLWVSLAFVDRLAPSELSLGPEDELVRRYQQVVAPRALLVRTIVSLVIALIAGSSVVGQWQHWLMFRDGVPFAQTDPQFHKNVAFFVFTMPFLSFVIGWAFVSLVVITILTVIAHYLNGGIRVQNGTPRVAPQVKAHLSVLLALIALVKAGGYFLQRYSLDFSTQGYVQGAGYTDVHARLPALTLLVWISLAAAVILLVNIRRKGWALPVLAVGLWAFVALVIGTIYPALVQSLKVNPAQDALEQPYIARNIAATRYAIGIDHVQTEPFAATSTLTPAAVTSDASTLNDVRLWDPELTGQSFEKLQSIRSYYNFDTLAVDRYTVNGKLTPVVVGVRQLNSNDLPAQGWVNSHLQYTHGYGMVVALSNQATPSGNPVFGVSDVPPVSKSGLPRITQPSVYYGVNNPGYVIANTRQGEIDYQLPNGTNVESHYAGTGGVQLSSFITRAAFAMRFGDINILISDLLTPRSRIMFVRDIQARVMKAAPFLSLGSNPYPILANGQILWVQNAYTTSSHYPYAQDANTSALPLNSGLQQTFNYVRNSVKVVVNAYSGKMTFYASDPRDPILQTWEKAFPGMFTPMSKMPSDVQALLRYPKDLFTVQASMFGRYHITSPQAFYNAGDAWDISQSPGAGSPNAALATTYTTNAQGQVVSTGQVARMTPLYEVLRVPGQQHVSFDLLDAFVPVSQGDQLQTLSGFMVASSDPGDYGHLTAFVTPRGESVDGPALIDARIAATPTVSQAISLLNQNGSSVLLGNVLMVPVNQAMLYVRPLYVQSSRNALPSLKDVIAVFGSKVAMSSTLQGALGSVLSTAVPSTNSSSPSTSSPAPVLSSAAQQLISQANSLYNQAQADLKAGNLGGYQSEVNQLGSVVNQLQRIEATSNAPVSTSTGKTYVAPDTKPTSTTRAPSGSAQSHSNSSGSGSSVTRSVPSTTTTTTAGEA
ncbi:MAG: UPF0182 family membrane protein [Acidimicrobiales bacterium]